MPHLGGLSALGVNCAACHVGEVMPPAGGPAVRVIGMPSHFDAEAFFGVITVATFRTADAGNMKRFLAAYLAAGDSAGGEAAQRRLDDEWGRQEARIIAAIAADPSGSAGLAPGALHDIAASDVRLDRATLERGVDLASVARSVLRLFHNMRASLHIPDELPTALPPASGPGRNDAFGLLSLSLLGVPQPHAPVKYGVTWNLKDRRWVHWDGNAQSPLGRNVLATLGLGAPLLGMRSTLDVAPVKRQTDLAELIRAPRYPFAIDGAAAARGAVLYQARCASCHDGPEDDGRLHSVEAIGTDPARARHFTPVQAARFNAFLANLEIAGYGVWARSPYLHNGSVRTMHELLTPPATRATTFRRGSRQYDAEGLGYTDAGHYVLDTATPGNSAAGHDHGTELSAAQKRDLIEHLKRL